MGLSKFSVVILGNGTVKIQCCNTGQWDCQNSMLWYWAMGLSKFNVVILGNGTVKIQCCDTGQWDCQNSML